MLIGPLQSSLEGLLQAEPEVVQACYLVSGAACVAEIPDALQLQPRGRSSLRSQADKSEPSRALEAKTLPVEGSRKKSCRVLKVTQATGEKALAVASECSRL